MDYHKNIKVMAMDDALEKEKDLEWAHTQRIAWEKRQEQVEKIRASVISSLILTTILSLIGFLGWAANAYIKFAAK